MISAVNINSSEQRWAIDLSWLQANNRSLATLAKGAVCGKCRKKLKIDHAEVKASDLLKSVKTCCSKSPGYITSTLPIQESTFRVFLANGNEPLTLEELSNQLSQYRGSDAYGMSSSMLTRLLSHDEHYGLRQL
jgi:hypothetical protein